MTWIRGPILNPVRGGTVRFIPDGALGIDSAGRINLIGAWGEFIAEADPSLVACPGCVICPAFLDAHTHIAQYPIRGKFLDGVEESPPQGRLLAGLNRNVFPAEATFADPEHARQVIADFLGDSLDNGVIGGSAYMTVHMPAVRAALEMLPNTWSAGPVLMNMNCPEYLRIDESTWERDVEALAKDFGRRLIISDRFAVASNSFLRRQACELARRLHLRMQTHLNEQIAEKELVEKTLYPDALSYTNVYERDGLLDCEPILAHCIHMTPGEFDIIGHKGACIAHCPMSNDLLGSGVMPLDEVCDRSIDYAICTDVGASPTVSLLSEMKTFLKVHAGKSKWATPQEALYRTTLAPAEILGLDDRLGSFELGKEATFVQVACDLENPASMTVDQVIRQLLEGKVVQVYTKGQAARPPSR